MAAAGAVDFDDHQIGIGSLGFVQFAIEVLFAECMDRALKLDQRGTARGRGGEGRRSSHDGQAQQCESRAKCWRTPRHHRTPLLPRICLVDPAGRHQRVILGTILQAYKACVTQVLSQNSSPCGERLGEGLNLERRDPP